MALTLLVIFVTSLVGSILHHVSGECPTENELMKEFNTASSQHGIHGPHGGICHITKGHDHDGKEVYRVIDEVDRGYLKKGANVTSCDAIYKLCRSVIIDLDLTTEECLEGHDHDNETSNSVSEAEAYGYGFVMIFLVSACSLGGIFLVPLIRSNSETGKRIYDHIYSFIVAIAISALVSDAVLHLIPHAFGIHGHQEGDGHSHDDEGEENQDFIWKGSFVLLGIYFFYLLETLLHTCGHSHHEEKTKKDSQNTDSKDTSPLIDNENHGSSRSNSTYGSIEEGSTKDQVTIKDSEGEKTIKYFLKKLKVKPVAWLIIISDSVHNAMDGLALGAAISQSLSLGLSTFFALLFHELPHEFGDFVILVKSGFHWRVALLLNFLHSLTAVVGFFVGVAISTESRAASDWILSITAGLFFYISLTDLLPELIHRGHNEMEISTVIPKWERILKFILINLGFLVAFTLLLILAIFEEDLNKLV